MRVDVLEGYQFVCNVDDVDNNDMEEFEVDGESILIVQLDGQFNATSAICSHEYARLCEGDIEDGCIICPLHFASFRISDGAALDPPATQPINIYDVKVHNDQIWVNTNLKGK